MTATTERDGTPGRRRRAAWAGVVSAAAALAAGQLPPAISGQAVDPVTAVGNEFVDRYAGSLKDLAVALFGQDDKTALVVGIVVTSLALGAVSGIVALRSLGLAAGGLAGFGFVGFVAHLTDVATSVAVPLLSLVLGVGAGVGALALLVPWVDREPALVSRQRSQRPVDDPRSPGADRRSFLVASGAVGGAAALIGLGAFSRRGRAAVAARRQELVLPEPVRTSRSVSDALDVPGLSPYVTPNSEFYRIDTALLTPQVDVDSWRLRISGLVDRPFELSFPELISMDLVEELVTLACVSNEVGDDLVGNAAWLGVPLPTLLDRAGVRADATQIVGRSVDGFTAGFPTDTARDGRVAMVAVGMNGEPLPISHGYPARLVVAGLYGYVSATKWLSELELTRFEDFDAYWIPRGWSKLGPVKTQSRIDVPRDRATVDPGRVAVGGVAWAPDRGIQRVEVQVDDGPWQKADLGGTGNDSTWVQWVLRWDAEAGDHVLRCRATDGTGEIQTASRADPRPDGATGHHTIRITVRSGS